LIHRHDLDIEDSKELKEAVDKLMIDHTEDAHLMFIRSCFRKGVKILTFDDGQQIEKIPNMHTKPILQLLIKYDKVKRRQHLITCAKDNKVKVWDWVLNKETPVATLTNHLDEVTSIALTNDA
jgi:WD40 repeat protein